MKDKKKILVFGAAGFIGTYLIDELICQEYEILASDTSEIGKDYCALHNIPFISIDITNKDEFRLIENEKFDAVIILAALQPANFSYEKFSVTDYMNVNVMGTLNILEYCKQNSISRVIYASSHRNTSGLWKNKKPIKESDGRFLEYNGEYAMFSISETAAQDCLEFYNANFNMKGVIFRLPPVYGYGPHLEIFKHGKAIKTGFQTFIENAKSGSAIEIWGDASIGRDIIYVKDVVDAFIKVINAPTINGLYNITSGYKLTLREEVETIAKVFWKTNETPIIIECPEKIHTMDSFVYINEKAKQDFGWEPVYNFEQMLIDYEIESKKNKFGFLLEKRKKMFEGNA